MRVGGTAEWSKIADTVSLCFTTLTYSTTSPRPGPHSVTKEIMPEEIQAPRPSPEISAYFEPEKGASMFRILRLSPKKGIRSPWYGPRVYERVDASNRKL